MPMAAIVPRNVATIEAARAISSVFLTAASRPLAFCMLPLNRFWYSCVEKPVQLPRLLASVKEKITMKAIGA